MNSKLGNRFFFLLAVALVPPMFVLWTVFKPDYMAEQIDMQPLHAICKAAKECDEIQYDVAWNSESRKYHPLIRVGILKSHARVKTEVYSQIKAELQRQGDQSVWFRDEIKSGTVGVYYVAK